MDLEEISTALKEGCWLHSFCLRGGMVVVHLSETPGGKIRGYGQHLHVEGALVHAYEDFLVGHCYQYAEVHKKTHSCVLTGNLDVSSALDAWIKCALEYSFDAYWGNGKFVAELHGFNELYDHFAQIGKGTTFDEAWKRAFSAARIKFRNRR